MAPKKESKVHPDLFNVTHQMVVDAIRAKLPRQTTYDHVKIIRLNCEPTDEELARFYAEIHNHLLEVASVSINKNVDFFEPEEGFADNFDPEIADEVPVLRPETQNVSYFVVELVGGPGEPRLQFAIRHDNLYCVSFRVLFDFDDAKTKDWFSFGEVYLLKCAAFPNVKKSRLSESYASATSVKIHPKVFRRIYTYFSEFNLKSNLVVGELMKDTFFVTVCEASRFGFVQRLTFHGMHAWEVPVGLTALMDDIIHDYHDLSVGTLLIWLSELEEKLRVAERARFKTDGQLTAALVAFNRYAPHVNFRGPNDHFQLDMVAGKGLYAPMFHSEIVRLIGMRLRNYDKKIRKLTDVSY